MEDKQFEIRRTRHINEEIMKNELPKLTSTISKVVELLAEIKLMAKEEMISENVMDSYYKIGGSQNMEAKSNNDSFIRGETG